MEKKTGRTRLLHKPAENLLYVDTITADTGLSKRHKEDVHYMDAKEHQSISMKNVTLDCIQTVLKITIFHSI